MSELAILFAILAGLIIVLLGVLIYAWQDCRDLMLRMMEQQEQIITAWNRPAPSTWPPQERVPHPLAKLEDK